MFFYLAVRMGLFGPTEKFYFKWTFSEIIWYLTK